ncbi:cytochrome P450 [Panus rudis PR-1116 ss-1]|nr:cytochrome P450 [Panus rudis PR-1116 ss-1]
MFWLSASILVSSVLLVQLLRKSQTKRRLPLPPGPKGYPLIGNMLDLPTVTPWKTYREWSRTYGELVYLDLPLRPTVILGSAKAAFDLLEKRSDIYSDRPANLMITLTGWGFNLGMMHYSDRWRAHRRGFHQYFNERAYQQWRPIQVDECHMFLRRLLDNPKDIDKYTRLVLSATILRIVYGMRINSPNEPYIDVVKKATYGFSVAVVPGTFWISYLPQLHFLLDWFPGTRYKQFAKEIRTAVDNMIIGPLKTVMKDMETNNAEPCIAASFLAKAREQHREDEDWETQEEIIANVTGVAHAAGAETTNSALQYFLIAMTLFPHVQKSAQEELDAVVGPHRLPEFEDFDKLVYIRAVVLESLRWQTGFPIGVPHRTMKDDEYNGYFIPRGAEIIPNAWAMLRDPEDYPDPEEFKPERYIKDGKLDPNVRDPSTIAFGFGRRICPGRHLASASLFLLIASTLHTFNIEPEGERFDPETMISDGFLSGPTKVPLVLKPRSKDTEQLILESSTM